MEQKKSLYHRAATDGLIMGGFLSIMFLLQSYGLNSPALSIVGLLMMVSVPVLAYFLLRRNFITEPGMRTFSAIWLHGIVIFLCASLLLGAVVYIFLRFLDPGFTVRQLHYVIDAYRELGTKEAMSIADTFESIIESKQVPTPIYLTFSMIWLTSFSGAVLSLLEAAAIKLFPPKQSKNQNSPNNI